MSTVYTSLKFSTLIPTVGHSPWLPPCFQRTFSNKFPFKAPTPAKMKLLPIIAKLTATATGFGVVEPISKGRQSYLDLFIGRRNETQSCPKPDTLCGIMLPSPQSHGRQGLRQQIPHDYDTAVDYW